MKQGELIVGLDVGTTKVCAVVAEARENGVDIIGIGTAPTRGLKKGVIVNIEGTVESIKKAVEEAGIMTGIDIKAVYVGISEGQISSLTSNGVIAVKEKEIAQRDIERVIDAARAMPLPFYKEVLHVIPAGFAIDGQNGINDPRGMSGVRLEVKVRIITTAVTSVQNLLKCCQRAGLEVVEVVFAPLASAEAVLTEDEKDIGVGIVDIGGGTTDIALFSNGSLCHTSVLSIGGNNFTNDAAIGLRTQTPEAERIKKSHGCAMMSMIDPHEEIEITYAGDKPGRKILRQHLIEILQPRAEELFGLIREDIRKGGYHDMLASGIVLTGGVTPMSGIDVMAENILELPVRIGVPENIGGMKDIVCSPEYITGVGLVLYGAREVWSRKGFNGGSFLNSAMNKFYSFPSKIKTWTNKIMS